MVADESNFSQFLADQAKISRKEPERIFLEWFVEQTHAKEGRSSATSITITEGSDGGVDAYVEYPTRVVLIQAKSGGARNTDMLQFETAISAFEVTEEKEFREWLQQVNKGKNKQSYLDLWRRIQRSNLKIESELAIFRSRQRTIEERFKHRINNREFHYYDKEELLYLYSLYQIGALRSPTLTLGIEGSPLKFYNSAYDFETQVVVVKLDRFLKFLREDPASELLFGRNVRAYHGENGKVNEGIKRTYETSPEDFFYGNNGIHIICNDCQIQTRSRITLENPQIINGSQTMHTLKVAQESAQDGYILTRITIIPKDLEKHETTHNRINSIVEYSNRNNKMALSDLRSNDPIQVELARKLISRGIFYERKKNEYSQSTVHQNCEDSITSTELGMLMVVCNGKRGPVYYKKLGQEPLFDRSGPVNQRSGLYPHIFEEANNSIDRTETIIRLHKVILKTATYSRRQLGERSKTIPRAGVNFALTTIFEALSVTNHPVKFPMKAKKSESLFKLINKVNAAMSKDYLEKLNDDPGLSINDFFREIESLKSLKQRFHNGEFNKEVLAVKNDFSL